MIKLWKKSCQTILDWWLELLFPELCLLCQQPGDWLCPVCLRGLGQKAHFVSSQQLYRLGKTSKIFSRQIVGVWYFWNYKDLRVKRLIYAYKFNQVRGLGQIFQILFSQFFQSFGDIEVVCVAPDRKRLRIRGFDHVKEMIPRNLVSDNVRLQRIKNSPAQSQISGFRERWKNLSKAFISTANKRTKSELKDKTIFLVDDVLTSGATAAAAAQALRFQADKIYLIVLAKA
jgi:predicted amidophosphoribosyltransferase